MSAQPDHSELYEILKRSNAERMDFFRKKRIAHPTLLAVRDQLCSTIKLRAGVDLAIVAGPTGVGKSTLINILQDQVERGQIDYLRADPGCVPVVVVEAPAPETSTFGWKDFFVRIMEALGEPLIERKVNVDVLIGPTKPNLRHPSLSTAELRRVTEKCLRHRKTAVLVVDEGHHMFRMGSGRRLLDCLETLKSFASYGTVFVVLVGTYDLTNALELNGQLGRRTALFNFARYELEGGFRGFLVALKGFQDRLPVRVPADLLSHAEYLYETSLGLVGVLKNHIERALALSLDAGTDTITADHLQASALAARARLEIAREIQHGEEFFKATADVEAAARKILGLKTAADLMPPTVPAKAKRRVGERHPHRDAVGVEKGAA
jgi:hypothetical protein